MFKWFEKRLEAYPEEPPREPPRGLVAFCLYYTRGAWPWIIGMAIFTTLIAIIEVSLLPSWAISSTGFRTSRVRHS